MPIIWHGNTEYARKSKQASQFCDLSSADADAVRSGPENLIGQFLIHPESMLKSFGTVK